jgi:hypothetical protein
MNGFRASIVPCLMVGLAACHGTAPTYSVSGSVNGSSAPSVVKLNGGNDISMSSDGSFKFTGKLLSGDTYNVQIIDVSDQCSVTGGAGTIDKSDITGVSIDCVPAQLQAFVRSANLSGAQLSPPVTTSAVGVGGLIVIPNATTMALVGGVTFSGLSSAPTQAVIQSASGATIVPLILGADGLTAVVPPATSLNTALLPTLLSGGFFFNVSSVGHPNGEIRAPIVLQGGVGASIVPLDKDQAVPPTSTTATGAGTLLVDLATGRLVVSYITHTVASATDAAIHTSTGHTTNGAVIIPFPNFKANIASGTSLATPAPTAQMSAQNLSDFVNALLYFDVRNSADLTSEIRGNIAPQ